MPEMDQGIKRLVQTHPQDVLALVLPGAQVLGVLPVDVATERQQVLDNLLRVRYQGVEFAVDLEIEAQVREDIAFRLYEYGMRARLVTRMPVLSAVLWLEPGGTPPTSPFEDRAGNLLSATRHFTGTELYKLSAEELFSRGLPGMLPLVAFSAQRMDLGAIERAARLVQERASAGDVPELETLLAVFAGRRFDMTTMRALLRRVFMNTEIIETSSLYQEILARGREQGIERGIEQGIEQGIERGVQHEAAEAVRVVLRSRFGELTPELEAAISRADVTHLHAALAHAVTATNDDLLALLREGQPQE